MITETIYGTLALPPSEADLIRRSLETHGEWGFVETALLGRLIRANDTLFDIGAYLGTFTLGLCTQGICNAVVVEPNPKMAPLLRKNLERNLKIPFTVLEVAVGERPGIARPTKEDEANLGAQVFERIDDEIQLPASGIQIKTLRQVRERCGPYDVLKLDIEGAELSALRSDKDWIRENKPIVWAECTEAGVSKGLFDFFREVALFPTYVAWPAWRKDNFKGAETHPYPIAFEASLLGTPSQLGIDVFSDFGEQIIIRTLTHFRDLREAMWITPRWGLPEWTRASKPELIAMLGRCNRGEKFSTFMVPKQRKSGTPNTST